MSCRLRLSDFVPKGQQCHFARVHITAKQQDPHNHDFMEVFWVEAGVGWHFINGVQRELRPGLLMMVRPEDCHAFSASEAGSLRIANVAFSGTSWRYVLKRYFPSFPDPFRLSDQAREFCLPRPAAMRMERLGGHFSSPPRGLAQIEGFLLELGNLIFNRRTELTNEPMPDWLARACRKIRTPENLPGGTRAFAALAGRSSDHAARAAKRWLKKTPTEIVNEARMDYASAQLVSGEETILNIALQCGFNNLAHFYLVFKTQFHTTPRRFRLAGRRIVGGLG